MFRCSGAHSGANLWDSPAHVSLVPVIPSILLLHLTPRNVIGADLVADERRMHCMRNDAKPNPRFDSHLRPERLHYSAMVHDSDFWGRCFVAVTVLYMYVVGVFNFSLYPACSVSIWHFVVFYLPVP